METSEGDEGAEDMEKENSALSVIYFILSLTPVHQLLLPLSLSLSPPPSFS
jgi:hypothetical protein